MKLFLIHKKHNQYKMWLMLRKVWTWSGMIPQVRLGCNQRENQSSVRTKIRHLKAETSLEKWINTKKEFENISYFLTTTVKQLTGLGEKAVDVLGGHWVWAHHVFLSKKKKNCCKWRFPAQSDCTFRFHVQRNSKAFLKLKKSVSAFQGFCFNLLEVF